MTAPYRSRPRIYAALVGVVGVLIVLQGLWAGVFIREGSDYDQTWVEVHARGADLAIVLALVSTVLAYAWFREHRALVVGSAALTVLLAFEAYLGGLIGSSPAVEAAHFPIALALVGLAVWLPLRSRALGRAELTPEAVPAPQRR